MQWVEMATWLHQDSPDLAKSCRDASLIGSQHNPAGAQIYWQHQHKKEVDDAHANCLATAVGLRCQRLLIKTILDFELNLLKTALDFVLVLMDTNYAATSTRLRVVIVRQLVCLISNIHFIHFKKSFQI